MNENQTNDQQVAENNGSAPSDSAASRLAQVKARAIEELLLVMPEAGEFSPERRFDIYMSAVRSSGEPQSAENALNAALSIEDQNVRADALSELVDEVEYLEIKNI